MPALENPKHEEFCLLLARNVKQGEAYKRAGYAENKGAASRLAASPRIQERVEELRKEIAQKINTAMTVPNDENFQTLAEMGLDFNWVATQFKHIYQESVRAGAFAAANTSVANIQKLIEMERNGKPDEEKEAKDPVNLTALSDVLGKVTELVRASKETPDKTHAETPMLDITPEEGEDECPGS